MNTESIAAIGSLIVAATLLLPTIGSLWKIFTIKERLASDIKAVENALATGIKDNAHRLDLAELKMEGVLDTQATAVNGMKELVGHVRSRSKKEADILNFRLTDVENYLAKTTDFKIRSRD